MGTASSDCLSRQIRVLHPHPLTPSGCTQKYEEPRYGCLVGLHKGLYGKHPPQCVCIASYCVICNTVATRNVNGGNYAAANHVTPGTAGASPAYPRYRYGSAHPVRTGKHITQRIADATRCYGT